MNAGGGRRACRGFGYDSADSCSAEDIVYADEIVGVPLVGG